MAEREEIAMLRRKIAQHDKALKDLRAQLKNLEEAERLERKRKAKYRHTEECLELVFTLRSQGKTYNAIGAEMGFSGSLAAEIYRNATWRFSGLVEHRFHRDAVNAVKKSGYIPYSLRKFVDALV